MARMRRWSGWVYALVIAVALEVQVSAITLEELDSMVMNHRTDFCLLSDCLGQYTAETCPQGTRWREGVAMGGCCGACVRFMKEGESQCTGKVDPKPCSQAVGECTNIYDGYGMCTVAGECKKQRSRRGAEQDQQPVAPMLSAAEQLQQLLSSLTREDETQVENILQSSWCDFGMYCANGQCKLESTWVTCINTQESFVRDVSSNNFKAYRDNYRWRPTCDIDGNYGPKQCKGYIDDRTRACECVDPLGNKLEGKAYKFQDSLYTDMNCLCSRRVYDRQQAGETGITLHCAENGNYEPLQCEKGWCYCVHPENGTIHGYQMPENALNLLPCYNRTLLGDLYLRKCDSTSHAYTQLTEFMYNKGVKTAPVAVASCNSDGSYGPTQCSNGACRCSNKLNKGCSVDSSNGCECIRDQLTYYTYGEKYSELNCVELLGSYAEDQELSAQGVLYRVDTQGNMAGPVVRIACRTYLQKSNLYQCQTVGNIKDLQNHNNCEFACSGGNTACPSSVYFYSPDYEYDSDTCIPP